MQSYTNTIIYNQSAFPLVYLNDKKPGVQAAPGSLIYANVIDKDSSSVTLETDDHFRFKADSGSVQGETGDRLSFEVVRNGKEGLVLKQILPKSDRQSFLAEGRLETQGMKALFKQSGLFAEDNDFGKKNMEEQLETLRAIAEIKQKLASGVRRLDGSAVQQLLAHGISLEKIGFNMLSDMMNSVETIRDKTVTAEERENAARCLEKVSSLDDYAIAKLLQTNQPLTYGSLYVAKFSVGWHKAPKMFDEATQKMLEPEIDKAFEREGIEKNEKTLEFARFLLSYDIPLTKQNVDTVNALKNMDEHVQDTRLIDRAVLMLREGHGINHLHLFEPVDLPQYNTENIQTLRENYKTLVEALPHIKPEKINLLVKQGIPLTLFNLRHTHETDEIFTEYVNKQAGRQADDTAVATAKRQLAEIQLKLTYQSAYRLAGKCIDIDTMPLQEALARLKAAENEGYAQSLKMMNAENTAENVSQMSRLYTQMAEMNPLTHHVFSNIINRVSPFTVSGIHQSVAFARMAENYGTFATVPNPKYGDAFAKVKSQFGALLSGMGVEPTDRNVKAAAILSRNHMDVTQETLDQVKLIDLKIDYIQNRLHPVIAASIIKDGLNPMDIHVDELISYINQFDAVFGEDLKEKIAGHIREMDMQKELTPQQRSAMLSIYRMLNHIEKEGGVALGVTVKNGVSPTLGHMLEASKYAVKAKGHSHTLAFDVDDSFGRLSDLIVPENNIASIFADMERATLRETTTAAINAFSFRRFAENADPRALATFLTENPRFIEKSLEQTAEALEENYESENLSAERKIDDQLAQLTQLFQSKATTIHWMEQNGIPLTQGNIIAMTRLRKDPFFLGKALDELDEAHRSELDDVVLDKSLCALEDEDAPHNMLQNLYDRLEDMKETETSTTLIRHFTLIQNAIKVQDNLQKKRELQAFELPIRLRSRMTHLNMYVLERPTPSSEERRILMALNTENLGNVQVHIAAQGGYVNLSVHSDDANALARLADTKDGLLEHLGRLGFDVGSLTFGVEPVKNMLEENMTPKVRRSDFAAKYENFV